MFVPHFVAAAFWRGCGHIFVAAASCATKIRNKILRVSWGKGSDTQESFLSKVAFESSLRKKLSRIEQCSNPESFF